VLLELTNISKSFRQGREDFFVFKDISLKIQSGQIAALVGPSGCGKSTLLQIIGLVDSPTHGSIFLDNQDCSRLTEDQACQFRRDNLGYIYQFHHLLPEFSAIENVAIAHMIKGFDKYQSLRKAEQTLVKFGLEGRMNNLPSELSGGEQQRVAIARAFVNSPKLILADEPTGNLDPHNSEKVFAEFISAAKEFGQTAIIVTHNMDLAAKADVIISFTDEGIEIK
jgi:lipoprotein-releasing system ATP-binding protein